MTPEERTREIKHAARDLGFDLVGVARAGPVEESAELLEWLKRGYHGTMSWMEAHREKRTDPTRLVPGCRSIVCVAVSYYHGDTGPEPEGVTVARYAWGADYHRVLKRRLYGLLDRCREIDPEIRGRAFTDSAPVMDKYWAERAGVGWRGKNTNLINKHSGSYLFLGELLLDADLVPDAPARDHCGTCTRCLDACPTDAFVEPYVLDARRCIAYWTIEHRGELSPETESELGEWLFGCDVCQSVCPWNRDPAMSAESEFTPRTETWPDSVDELISLTDVEFERRFGGTAVERTRRAGLVRNAAILAGTRGVGSRDALERASRDADPIVARTARRALERRQRAEITPC